MISNPVPGEIYATGSDVVLVRNLGGGAAVAPPPAPGLPVEAIVLLDFEGRYNGTPTDVEVHLVLDIRRAEFLHRLLGESLAYAATIPPGSTTFPPLPLPTPASELCARCGDTIRRNDDGEWVHESGTGDHIAEGQQE